MDQTVEGDLHFTLLLLAWCRVVPAWRL